MFSFANPPTGGLAVEIRDEGEKTREASGISDAELLYDRELRREGPGSCVWNPSSGLSDKQSHSRKKTMPTDVKPAFDRAVFDILITVFYKNGSKNREKGNLTEFRFTDICNWYRETPTRLRKFLRGNKNSDREGTK
jgi:hypothetical protein